MAVSSTTVVTLRELMSSKYGFSVGPAISDEAGDESPPDTRAAAEISDEDAVEVLPAEDGPA